MIAVYSEWWLAIELGMGLNEYLRLATCGAGLEQCTCHGPRVYLTDTYMYCLALPRGTCKMTKET